MPEDQREIARQSSDPGIRQAWEALDAMGPETVARNAGVTYEDGAFQVRSFGMDYVVRPAGREIRAVGDQAEALQRQVSHFFEISWLWYLVKAQDFGLTSRHLKPEQLKGGHHFFKGAHELPLKELAEKFGSDRAAFLERGRELGGRELTFGDASVELWPLPRIPIQLILWLGDDEFPARADLLLDSSCELQLPLDVLWSVAMMSVSAMLG